MNHYRRLSSALLISSLTHLLPYASSECTLGCQNDGQCVFYWSTTNESFYSFEKTMACECAPGFNGPACENEIKDVDDQCTLECDNGGECVFEWTTVGSGVDSIMYQGSFMACDCLPGYMGMKCEHQYNSCPDGKICMNGSTCVEADDETEQIEDIDVQYKCDCADAYIHAAWAGDLCESAQIEYCDYDTFEERHFFCANGGKCHKVTLEENETEHHGCECPEGFEGHHCEFPKETSTSTQGEDIPFETSPRSSPQATISESNQSVPVIGIALACVLAFIAIAGGMCVMYFRSVNKLPSNEENQGDDKKVEAGSNSDTGSETSESTMV